MVQKEKKKKSYSMYNMVASSHGLPQELSYLARGLETCTTRVMTWIHILDKDVKFDFLSIQCSDFSVLVCLVILEHQILFSITPFQDVDAEVMTINPTDVVLGLDI